jgi:hypothetical protein
MNRTNHDPGDGHDRRITNRSCATAFQKKLAARSDVELSSKIELGVWCFGNHFTAHRNERRESEQRV